MSADNYVVLRKFAKGYRWGMGFASDEYPEGRLPIDKYRSEHFPTAEEAADDALQRLETIEYGFQFDSDPVPFTPRKLPCVCCGTAIVETLQRGFENDAVYCHVNAGFGSDNDGTSLEFVICDECIEAKHKAGVIAIAPWF